MAPFRRLQEAAARDERLVLGLMSGMSRDGIDVALLRVRGRGEEPRAVTLVGSHTVPYDQKLRDRLAAAVGGDLREAVELDGDLAEHWAEACVKLLSNLGVDRCEVAVVGSHGQTIFHRPRRPGRSAATWQIGQPAVLAERLRLPVVGDFRARDIAAGGEGAPLIPLADVLLFGQPDETVACHNLGSIANVTVIPPVGSPNLRLCVMAFDTGPANALIDAFAALVPGAEGEAAGGIDRDGELSANGVVSDDMLLAAYTHRASWLRQQPPKSAGYATWGADLAQTLAHECPDVAPLDRVRTAVEITAQMLRDAYEWHVLPAYQDLSRVHLSGGGCRNPTLMAAIQARFADLDLVVAPLEAGLSDAKEAMGFALLADEALQGRAGNVPAATGAGRPVPLGTWVFP